jgi:hypothetical protein
MTDTHMFMTKQDTVEFSSFLMKQYDAWLVLDESPMFPLPEYKTDESVDHPLGASQYSPRFFVMSPIWQKHPLSVTKIKKQDGRTLYYVDQKYGGPAFDFKTCWDSVTDSEPFIVGGWFMDYAWYIVDKAHLQDQSKYRTFNRPDSMTQAHKDVRKYLRRNGRKSICRETGRGGPWILAGALEAHAQGTWLRQGDWHFDPRTVAVK